MPNLTLRLTDEQHKELADAAWLARRSLQQEIIYRLFGAPEPQSKEPAAAVEK